MLSPTRSPSCRPHPRSLRSRLAAIAWASALAIALAGVPAAPAAGQGYLDEVGYTLLQSRLPAGRLPGAGAVVAQVEAPGR